MRVSENLMGVPQTPTETERRGTDFEGNKRRKMSGGRKTEEKSGVKDGFNEAF